MHSSTFITTFAFFAATGLASYVLEDDYIKQGFFQQFDFFDGADPTQGFVAFKNQADAQSQGLIETGDGYAKLMVDSSNVTPNGRPSVRLGSTKTYSAGLIVADIGHMPGGICGTWPAFWMLGPNWPAGGEIDIFEGKNDQTSNNITLHTGSSCSITQNDFFTGEMTGSYCGPAADNHGCQISSTDDNTYGTGFNAAGGGIYATEWTSSALNVWFFTNGTAPADIHSDTPNPSTWGKPLASFSGTCDMATAFVDQQIVIDTTFCGSWAGTTWSQSPTCMSKASTCEDYVANNPAAFSEAYWTFNGLRVYQNSGSLSAESNSASFSASASVSVASSTPAAVSTTTTSAPADTPSSSSASVPTSTSISTSVADSTSTSTSAAPTSTSTSTLAPAPTSSTTSEATSPMSAPASSSASSEAAPSTSAPSAPTEPPTSISAPSMSTYIATETTIVYVTAPQATTFAVSTSSTSSSTTCTSSTSSGGYAPIIGGNGGVNRGSYGEEAHHGGGFRWSTGANGDAVYGGKKREEDGVKGRHARHLGRHRRREGGF